VRHVHYVKGTVFEGKTQVESATQTHRKCQKSTKREGQEKRKGRQVACWTLPGAAENIGEMKGHVGVAKRTPRKSMEREEKGNAGKDGKPRASTGREAGGDRPPGGRKSGFRGKESREKD